jgi:hypothetical protein
MRSAEAILKLRAFISNGELDAHWDYHLSHERHRNCLCAASVRAFRFVMQAHTALLRSLPVPEPKARRTSSPRREGIEHSPAPPP